MTKLTKKQIEKRNKLDLDKFYNLSEASSLIKKNSNSKFDESIDIAIRLQLERELKKASIYYEKYIKRDLNNPNVFMFSSFNSLLMYLIKFNPLTLTTFNPRLFAYSPSEMHFAISQ